MARILVCDDDDKFSDLIVGYLEKAGHAVTRCADVSQLANLLGHEHMDLIITDIQMPGGGGPAAARLLQTLDNPDIPMLVVSGMPVEAQAKWFQDVKRVRFLQKPVAFEALRRNVEELLAPPPQ